MPGEGMSADRVIRYSPVGPAFLNPEGMVPCKKAVRSAADENVSYYQSPARTIHHMAPLRAWCRGVSV